MNKLTKVLVLVLVVVVVNFFAVAPISAQEESTPVVENPAPEANTEGSENTDNEESEEGNQNEDQDSSGSESSDESEGGEDSDTDGKDAGDTAGDSTSFTANSTLAENIPPVSAAGNDQATTLPLSFVTLNGSYSFDPDGEIVSYVWTFVSGPTEIDPDDVVSPHVDNLIAGTYVFKLTVTDNGNLTNDNEVSITVIPEGENLPPIADTGDDQEITLPLVDSVTLDGSDSSDPEGGQLIYSWVFVSGPTEINPDDVVSPTVDNLTLGTYIFKLVVMDDGKLIDDDEVSVRVILDPDAPNLPPVVDADAGVNRKIALPMDSVNINNNGTSSDLDGEIVSYVWTWNAGPSVIDPEDIENPIVSGLVEGTYSFILTVTDNDGATAWDHIDIIVLPLGSNRYCADGVELTRQEFHQALVDGVISNDKTQLKSVNTVKTGKTETTYVMENPTGCIMHVSFTSWKIFTWEESEFLETQVLLDLDEVHNADPVVTMRVDLTSCISQLDVWYGKGPENLSPPNDYGNPGKTPFVFAYGYGGGSWNLCGDNPPTDVCPNIEGVQTEVPEGMEKNDNGDCVDDDNGGGGGGRRTTGGGRRAPQGEVLGEQAPPIVPAVLGLPTTGVGDSAMNIIILSLSGLITMIGLISLAWPQKGEQPLATQTLPVAPGLNTTAGVGFSSVLYSNSRILESDYSNWFSQSSPAHIFARVELIT